MLTYFKTFEEIILLFMFLLGEKKEEMINAHGISCTSTLKILSNYKETGRMLVSDLMPMLYAVR